MTDPTTLREALIQDWRTYENREQRKPVPMGVIPEVSVEGFLAHLATRLEAAKYAVAKRVAGREVCTQADVDETFITALRGTEE